MVLNLNGSIQTLETVNTFGLYDMFYTEVTNALNEKEVLIVRSNDGSNDLFYACDIVIDGERCVDVISVFIANGEKMINSYSRDTYSIDEFVHMIIFGELQVVSMDVFHKMVFDIFNKENASLNIDLDKHENEGHIEDSFAITEEEYLESLERLKR